MKIIAIIFSLFIVGQTGFSQNQFIDTILQKLTAIKDDNNKVDFIVEVSLSTSEADPMLAFKNQQQILSYAIKNKDLVSEGVASSNIGYCYRGFGDNNKSMEYAIKGYALAEKAGNERAMTLANNVLGDCYTDIGNYAKAIELFRKVIEQSQSINYTQATEWGLQNLTEVYILTNQYDSALRYSQRDYEISARIDTKGLISYTFINLATIHGKMGNEALAKAYYDMAVNEGIKNKSPKQINWAYTSKAEYFKNNNQFDSAIITAKKAIDAVTHTNFANYALQAAKLLLDIYRQRNTDSAFKYSELYHRAKDSLFSAQVIQQTQTMTFENRLREEKLTEEKLKADVQRKQNLQYILIALGIFILFSIYLLLSRSFITNTKLIKFFGVIALLIVFEFLNLLLHPFLERVMHHSPVLMLLALVCIAALLVPLHHKLEKWATTKLVEKNKKIRLAAAKKTIEKLEGGKT
ncbi:MAG: tetratricopeptide repeat protein [Chitinophagaceae bacterium]